MKKEYMLFLGLGVMVIHDNKLGQIEIGKIKKSITAELYQNIQGGKSK